MMPPRTCIQADCCRLQACCNFYVLLEPHTGGSIVHSDHDPDPLERLRGHLLPTAVPRTMCNLLGESTAFQQERRSGGEDGAALVEAFGPAECKIDAVKVSFPVLERGMASARLWERAGGAAGRLDVDRVARFILYRALCSLAKGSRKLKTCSTLIEPSRAVRYVMARCKDTSVFSCVCILCGVNLKATA